VEGTPEGPEDATSPSSGTNGSSNSRAVRTGLSWLVRLVIIGGFAIGVWLNAQHELTTIRSATSKQIVAHWDVDQVYWSCLTTQVQSLVPAGQSVWVSPQAPNASASNQSLWKATAGVRPISSNRLGVIDLYLVKAPKGKGCLEVDVEAVHPTGIINKGNATVPPADWTWWMAAHSRNTP
jgi:hypothetical protein